MSNTNHTSEVKPQQIQTGREVVQSAPLPRGFYRGPWPRRHFVISNADEDWARRVANAAKRR